MINIELRELIEFYKDWHGSPNHSIHVAIGPLRDLLAEHDRLAAAEALAARDYAGNEITRLRDMLRRYAEALCVRRVPEQWPIFNELIANIYRVLGEPEPENKRRPSHPPSEISELQVERDALAELLDLARSGSYPSRTEDVEAIYEKHAKKARGY